MRIYYGNANVGDTLSPFILEYFTDRKAERVNYNEKNKLLMVGSFLDVVEDGDILAGVGSNNPNTVIKNNEFVPSNGQEKLGHAIMDILSH